MSRYYDPVTHRFVNADVHFQSGGDVLDTNMSAYCGNNPINYFDSNGECKTHVNYYKANCTYCNPFYRAHLQTERGIKQYNECYGTNYAGVNDDGDFIHSQGSTTWVSHSVNTMNAGITTAAGAVAPKVATQTFTGALKSSAAIAGPLSIASIGVDAALNATNPFLTTDQKWTLTGVSAAFAVGGIVLVALASLTPFGWLGIAASVVCSCASTIATTYYSNTWSAENEKNGVTEHKIKTVYKIAIGLNIYLVLISLINLIYDVLTQSKDIFFGTMYLWLVPYFKFLDTQNYLEIIPAVIIISVTLYLLFKSIKGYYKTKSGDTKPSYFLAIFQMWIFISSVFSYAVCTHCYSIDDYASSMAIYLLNGIYQAIIVLLMMNEYYKNNPYEYMINPQKVNDLQKFKNVLMFILSLPIFLMSTIKYCSGDDYIKLITMTFVLFVLFIVFMVTYTIYYYIKLTKRYPEQKWDKATKSKYFIREMVVPSLIFFIVFALIMIL